MGLGKSWRKNMFIWSSWFMGNFFSKMWLEIFASASNDTKIKILDYLKCECTSTLERHVYSIFF